VSRVALG